MFTWTRASFLVLLICFACCACGSAQTESRKNPCDSLEESAGAIWNEIIRDRVNLSVRIIDGQFQAAEIELVTIALNRFAANWDKLGKSGCHDHFVQGTASDEEYATLKTCLDAGLEDLREAVALLEAGDKEVVEKARALSETMERCALSNDGESVDIKLNPFEAADGGE